MDSFPAALDMVGIIIEVHKVGERWDVDFEGYNCRPL